MSEREEDETQQKQTLIFSYGTLKRGFSNHRLMQDLISSNDAYFLGDYHSLNPLPLVCGPHGVPFLLNLPSSAAAHHRVHGELYSVSLRALLPLDHLEGISLGHYERLPIQLLPANDGGGTVVEAEAYYAHRSYAEQMWRRNGRVGFRVYSENEAKDYVRRDLRPKDRTFLEDIQLFVSSSSS